LYESGKELCEWKEEIPIFLAEIHRSEREIGISPEEIHKSERERPKSKLHLGKWSFDSRFDSARIAMCK